MFSQDQRIAQVFALHCNKTHLTLLYLKICLGIACYISYRNSYIVGYTMHDGQCLDKNDDYRSLGYQYGITFSECLSLCDMKPSCGAVSWLGYQQTMNQPSQCYFITEKKSMNEEDWALSFRCYIKQKQSNLSHASSCSDKEMNGDEAGIDCGGSCPNQCCKFPIK